MQQISLANSPENLYTLRHAFSGNSKQLQLHDSIHLSLVYTDYSFSSWLSYFVPSVLWHCWLGIMKTKSIRHVKNWWGADMVICLQWGANDLRMVRLMPLPPIISCFIKIQIGLVKTNLAYTSCLEKRLLNGCVLFLSCESIWTHVLTACLPWWRWDNATCRHCTCRRWTPVQSSHH